MIKPDKPIIGYPFAAPLSGKDTVQKGLVKRRPQIAVIHMSTLLDVVIEHKAELKQLRQKGELLPSEEAIKAFRRGFLEVTRCVEQHPHIFANGACREEIETRSNMDIVRRTTKGISYQQVGFRFLLDKEHIMIRAKKRIEEMEEAGLPPRKDDLGHTPLFRYQRFHQNLEPILKAFQSKGGVVVDIDANQEPDGVLIQVMSVYDSAPILI